MTELYRRWIDADRLAASTARIALAQPVEKLQAIAREAAGMRAEPCAERALSALQRLTSASSEGMLEFMLRTEVKTMVNRLVEVPKLTADFEWQIESANCPSLRPGQASPRQP